MPDLPHLKLPQTEFNLPRKKHGFGRSLLRDSASHGKKLEQEIGHVIGESKKSKSPEGINPTLILKIKLADGSVVDEDIWGRNQLSLLSTNSDQTLILFASDYELKEFHRRLHEYQNGPPEGQKSAPHNQLFSSIEEVDCITAIDRIGRLLNLSGITEPDNLIENEIYTLDLELWPLENRHLIDIQIDEIRQFLVRNKGELLDYYAGSSLILLRVRCTGQVVKELLEIESIATIDFPPQADASTGEMLDLTIDEFPLTPEPPDGAPSVTILDTGITPAHPFLATTIGEATRIPNSIADEIDRSGHGTSVAGLAIYGDVRQCVENGSFIPELFLYSAKVLNDDRKFPDEKLIMTQMSDVIYYFNTEYGSRVFNLSLGDDRLVYDDGKIGGWATVLDTLSREFDVVIIVSAGNYTYNPGDDDLETIIQNYPSYLFADEARIIEPATGSIVVTVGSIADSHNTAPGIYEDLVTPLAIAQQDQPSPFTRSGPGCGGAIKPEFCEYGGNVAFDGVLNTIRKDIDELSTLSLNHDYLTRLFKTNVGTSFAAPRVAHTAARILGNFQNASANLVRALLAISSTVPEESVALLEQYGNGAIYSLCGYGKPDYERASYSDQKRVVLHAEAQLSHDNFHIFEIPMIEDYLSTTGRRSVTVSLAYDPPVRHTRIDYLGVKMSFRLIRGKSVEEVAEVFRKRHSDEEAVESLSTKFNCGMLPGPEMREGGTLQKASFVMHKNPANYGNTYYLVVRCEKKWANEEIVGPQKYAVVVEIEHTADIEPYTQLQQRVQAPVRVRV